MYRLPGIEHHNFVRNVRPVQNACIFVLCVRRIQKESMMSARVNGFDLICENTCVVFSNRCTWTLMLATSGITYILQLWCNQLQGGNGDHVIQMVAVITVLRRVYILPDGFQGDNLSSAPQRNQSWILILQSRYVTEAMYHVF